MPAFWGPVAGATITTGAGLLADDPEQAVDPLKKEEAEGMDRQTNATDQSDPGVMLATNNPGPATVAAGTQLAGQNLKSVSQGEGLVGPTEEQAQVFALAGSPQAQFARQRKKQSVVEGLTTAYLTTELMRTALSMGLGPSMMGAGKAAAGAALGGAALGAGALGAAALTGAAARKYKEEHS